MATALQHSSLKAPAGNSVLDIAIKKLKAFRTYRTALNELRSLSNRELADLGLHRSMIKRVALEAAYDGI
ncbi:DUF1127 domain-containing protein [Epibacterium sp. SM1969]|uniref:DUF1127 domain-containing protein n=1 Tax=Tritonibacter aquimaris TaxID=2663379 RepID=A0A844ASM4_9RHOB|nr:DUF1127 domain-containing protein [Tritonibacter aquimaris]MQY41021.1 DUF1127 domain-containing protein [Tritonibacter aquimaris]